MPDAPRKLLCPRCGSDAVIPDARLVDRGDGDARKTLDVGLETRPDAVVFKKETRVPLRAQVCGDCGFVDLFATDPGRMWEAYLDRMERVWERGGGR